MPLQATSGAASYDAFGGGVPVVPNYIEEVFSTYVYKGTGSQNQNITNGIDLSTKGGLVWIKSRIVTGLDDNWLQDTARGIRNGLKSNSDAAQVTNADVVTAVLTNGYTDSVGWGTSDSVASWTFRKQPKFFDVVTYTGTGATQNIAHSLGSTPACMIIKRTDSINDWIVYHRSLPTPATNFLYLDLDLSYGTSASMFGSTNPTSSVFTVGSNNATGASGGTYVAYLFAHDAGGFGLTGTDNVISCGTFTTNGSGVASVTLGYEPQWLLFKGSSSATNWQLVDNMRGLTTAGSDEVVLFPNAADEESAPVGRIGINATGFTTTVQPSITYIYIAIRRGPMKVPTSGTSVFSPITSNASTGTTNTTNFPVDFQINAERGAVHANMVVDRLRGVITTPTDALSPYLASNTSNGENPETVTRYWNNTGFETSVFQSGASNIYWNFRRAPSFHDIVCYTGTGANTTVTHSLQAIPELIIVKRRSAAADWAVYSSALANTEYLVLNATTAKATGATWWNSTTPTSSVFSVGTSTTTNASAGTYVAYLFATCAGVSKIGSYTLNGNPLTVNCGFTSGARFVMIRRTDAASPWYVWDTARGISSGNDPYLRLNATTAEDTASDLIGPDSSGFVVNTSFGSAGTFIFLAIA
jgi:hypothetical protein